MIIGLKSETMGRIFLRTGLIGGLISGVRLLFRYAFTVFIVSLALTTPSLSGPLRPTLTQYAHTAWRVADGDLEGAVNGIAQTKSGYLWIATAAGLVRYDGAAFRNWTTPMAGPAFSVLGDREGSLWVGGYGAAVHMVDGHAPTLIDSADGQIDAFLQDRSGTIWVARSHLSPPSNGLCRAAQGRLHCLVGQPAPFCNYGVALAQAQDGKVLVASNSGVCRAHGENFSPIDPKPQPHPNAVDGVTSIAVAPDGTTYVGRAEPGVQGGLQAITSRGEWSAVKLPDFDGSRLAVQALLWDRDGGLWVGTVNEGLYRIAGGRVSRFTRADGLSGDSVTSLFQDREGSVWVGTSSGLDRFHPRRVVTFSTREGLGGDSAHSVQVGPDGTVYIGNAKSLDILTNGIAKSLGRAQGLPGDKPTSLLVDHEGVLWLGIDKGLATYTNGQFKSVPGPNGQEFGIAGSIVEDNHHDIWLLTAAPPHTLFRLRHGSSPTIIDLPRDIVLARLETAPDGEIWAGSKDGIIGTLIDGVFKAVVRLPETRGVHRFILTREGAVLASSNRGLWIFYNGILIQFDISDAIRCKPAIPAIEDVSGSIWLRTPCGIVIVRSDELLRWVAHPKHAPQLSFLAPSDGALPGPSSFFEPRASMSPDGRLWFATNSVLLSVDPARLGGNALPPPVHVERLVANHRAVQLARDPVVPPLTHDLQIEYSALSLVDPKLNQYQYRLLPIEKDWQDVGTRRLASYTDLHPGNYEFEVRASNNNAVWNTRGDVLEFRVSPAFWQTIRFQAAALLLLVASLWLVIRARLDNAVAQAESRLMERQAERVRIARELHDTLLQGFHGLIARFQAVAFAIPADSPAKSMIESALERADEIVAQGRDSVSGLRSGNDDSSSLMDSLQAITDRLREGGSTPIALSDQGMPRGLNGDVQHEILAILKEALANASDHAGASRISCTVIFARSYLALIVEDDGRGIDPNILRAHGRTGHWGLRGMEERARQINAALNISSSPDAGARVELTVSARIAYRRARTMELLPSLARRIFRRERSPPQV